MARGVYDQRKEVGEKMRSILNKSLNKGLFNKNNIARKVDYVEGRGCNGVVHNTSPKFQFETVATLGGCERKAFQQLCYGESTDYDYEEWN